MCCECNPFVPFVGVRDFFKSFSANPSQMAVKGFVVAAFLAATIVAMVLLNKEADKVPDAGKAALLRGISGGCISAIMLNVWITAKNNMVKNTTTASKDIRNYLLAMLVITGLSLGVGALVGTAMAPNNVKTA